MTSQISSQHNPRISIIIATLNSERFLERCIQSIIIQAYPNIEIIIKDGGSCDDTISIIKKYALHIAYWESTRDRGIYDAWNIALTHCSGDWICFMGSDDYFLNKDILTQYAEFLKDVPFIIKVAYGINHIINSRGELLYKIGRPWDHLKKSFHHSMCLPHPGLMHHFSLFQIHGNFNPQFKIAGDYDLLLRELKTNEAVFFEKSICATPVGGASTIPENSIKCLMEILYAQRKNNIRKNYFKWVYKMIIAILRSAVWNIAGEKRARLLFDTIRSLRGLPPFWTKAA